MVKNKENWFVDWFNSSYYYLLYQNRDFSEAEDFIARLMDHLSCSCVNPTVLDLACGNGRHSIQLNEMGYDVLGLDLSKNNIEYAKQFSNERLHFKTADMRELPMQNHFDLVLNLFTSFGYFQEEKENQKVITSISKALKKDGRLVLDYLNAPKVSASFPHDEVIQRGEITFQIKKFIENGFIVKDIQFDAKGEAHHYREYVKNISLQQFKQYFESNDLELISTFGDYKFGDFDLENSDRLIMIAKKK